MPRGDGTGPAGLGPMTGRAAGYCTGHSVPGFANPVGHFGMGRGFKAGGHGHGRGFGNMYWATGLSGWVRYNTAPYYPNYVDAQPAMTPAREADALKNQARHIQEGLNAINARILELEKLTAEEDKS